MVAIAADCPHCGTEKAGFDGSQYHQVQPGRSLYSLFMKCNVCGQSIVANFFDGQFSMWINGHKEASSLAEIFPKPAPSKIPEYLPDNISNFYRQGMGALRRQYFDSAGIMFRKCVDVAIKSLRPDGKGSLQKRIDDLPPELGVTPAMKNWAHLIRLLGNDAAHEDEPFEENDAEDLQLFTELLLTYIFTLPAMLAARAPAAVTAGASVQAGDATLLSSATTQP